MTDAGTVDIHTNAFSIGGMYPAVAKLRISGTLLTTNWTAAVSGAVLPFRPFALSRYLVN